ncbi:MAG: hydrogenase nickel incorporation protein HypB [Bacteroidetes bacterium]|nr:hydrogenase nickel incorporation protein HypB [Bacteroidota bacterium]
MCETCGCGEHDELTIRKVGQEDALKKDGLESQKQETDHDKAHRLGLPHHHHEEAQSRRIVLEKDVLYHNNLVAAKNRGFLEAKGILCLNLVSSPGSGKTTLLEKTIQILTSKRKVFVIEGDQQSELDAARVAKAGAEAVQINTGTGCHLDASMVERALKILNPPEGSIVFIENVGNLVCPSLFDLGEYRRVLIISTTEGEDKPLKYPYMFRSSHLCVINKTDLLPHIRLDMGALKSNIHHIHPDIDTIQLSALTGEGFPKWVEWISRFTVK